MRPLHTPPPSLAYRPDIDGLRAVAILSVVVFHAFPSLLRGGFIGVDVFFVISGFLISSIIFRGLQRGDFSFADFYLHRLNRIFPALVVVLAACYAVGWFQLMPDEFKQLGRHMAAGAGFIQNFVLWKEAGYFDTASELKPLMHLWSLAIEEQFYLIYPLLIWGAWRLRWNTLAVVAGFFLLSFILNVTGVKKDAVATFFLPQTRFWELLAGALLAGMQLVRGARLSARTALATGTRDLANGLSVLGLLLIVAAALGVHQGKLFPGWWALAPVAGAFLLIWAGPQAWANRKILASRPMVFVGLISYPLYLWHWPMLVFARFAESGLPSLPIRVGAVAMSFLLAWLTYRLVERPVRRHKGHHKSLVIFGLLVAMGALGFNAFQNEGFGSRARFLGAGDVFKTTDLYTYFDYRKLVRKDVCHSVPLQVATANGCIQIAEKSIFLWGDSYAAALFSGVDELVKKRHGDYVVNQLTDGNGPPFFTEDRKTDEQKPLIQANNDRLEAVRQTQPRVVLISWMIQGQNGIADKPEALARLLETIDRIKKASPSSRVIVIGPVPEWKITLQRQMLNFYRRHGVLPPRYMNDGLKAEIKPWDEYFKARLPIAGVEYISAYDQLCNENGCLTRTSDEVSDLSAVDWGHLTRSGSIFLLEKIEGLVFK